MAKSKDKKNTDSLEQSAKENDFFQRLFQARLFVDLSKEESTQHGSALTIDDESLFTADFTRLLKGFAVYSVVAVFLVTATIWLVDYRQDSAFSTLKGEVVAIKEATEETYNLNLN